MTIILWFFFFLLPLLLFPISAHRFAFSSIPPPSLSVALSLTLSPSLIRCRFVVIPFENVPCRVQHTQLTLIYCMMIVHCIACGSASAHCVSRRNIYAKWTSIYSNDMGMRARNSPLAQGHRFVDGYYYCESASGFCVCVIGVHRGRVGVRNRPP